MNNLAEKCNDLLNEWDHRIDFDGNQASEIGEQMANLIRNLSNRLGEKLLTDRQIDELLPTVQDGWSITDHCRWTARATERAIIAKLSE